VWPDGVVGALTHCDGYRGAAVALRGRGVAGVGIDAEVHAPLPDGVLAAVARADEVEPLAALAAARPGTHWDRLLFSAKESIYKAWFPLARTWLGFEDARLEFDAAAGTFAAELHKAGPLSRVDGRFLVADGLVLTAVVVAG
jgi:4'-phosphopantetheinyl transferase EntD